MGAHTSLRAQVTYDDLQKQAQARNLNILGGFHPSPEDGAPNGCRTLLMLGPDEPGFWPAFKSSSEWLDGAPDPMDRWSARVIGNWAEELGGLAVFPFGGPPFLPFFSWATRTGRIHVSPILLLVHDSAGLFVSFRGALALQEQITLPVPPKAPCLACIEQPCRHACPVNAFDGKGYDVPACKSHLDSDAGASCMTLGCGARLACPVSQRYPRIAQQSAYHMNAFKG